MTDWRPISEAPDDFERPGGQRTMRVRDREDRKWTARRTLWNNSGWREDKTNKELWPVWFDPASLQE